MNEDEQSGAAASAAGDGAELERGRECYRQRAWADAHRWLSAAARAAPLAPGDLELLSTVAYLLNRDSEYLDALERAHRAHLAVGEVSRSARCAFWLGLRLAFRGDTGQATGWFARAERLLERAGQTVVEHGYLLLPVVERHLDAAEVDAAYAAAARAVELGERFDDGELVALARHQQGRARLGQGRLAEGLALLDEAMLGVIGGQLSPVVTGLIYCSVIQSCQQVYAVGRAREWTTALARWCDQQPDMVAFSGICRVHRAEILELGGAWAEAIAEARRPCERADTEARSVAAAAFYQLGELHRLRGDFAAAEAAYRSASQLGCEPQPGLALLRLAEGQPDVALAALRRSLILHPDGWQRTRLLPAYVESLLGKGELEEGRTACAELVRLARGFDTGVLRAMAAQAEGALALAEGHLDAALLSFHAAAAAWREVEAPYHVARVRSSMGLAYRALGDEEGGQLELSAARVVFEQLGAGFDVQRIDALLRPAPAPAHPLSARELEVLRGVARGKTNKLIAAELFLSERTVDRHVSNIFIKLGVSARAAATAYAYEHELI